MLSLANVNFKILPIEEAVVPILDHGFLFGDSVYEVIRTYKGNPFFVKEHLERLYNSAKGISLEIPWTFSEITNEINRTVEAAKNDEAYIRVIITRGTGEIDIDPISCKIPTLIIIVKKVKVYPEEYFTKGVKISLVSVMRNHRHAINPAYKTGNYLNSILAYIEAKKKGSYDAVMVNSDGYITEGTTNNFFMIRNEKILTPALECGILEGITRKFLLKIARERGIVAEEGFYKVDEIRHAKEIFITSTLKGAMPVYACDDIIIGNGKAGNLTKQLGKWYWEEVARRIDDMEES